MTVEIIEIDDLIEIVEVLIPGPPGPPGSGGAGSSFVFQQSTPLDVWTVPHNLNRFPSVTVTDHLGEIMLADAVYVDSNIVQITHGTARIGFVYLN